MSNFKFLKQVDNDLYNLIKEAENLYRDEYFEQCIIQTRKFGEISCKNILGNRLTTEKTFDDMLATLKDKVSSSIQEKEFVEDLYFLKKEGNASVHTASNKNKGMLALECLQRAFEIAINYAVYYKKANSSLLKQQFDIEILIMGEKSKKSLKDKYNLEKLNQEKIAKTKKIKNKTVKNKKIQSYQKKHFSFFKIFFLFASIVSLVLVLVLFILAMV
ncbi:hypothetical protein IKB17_05650 [bacterium]|nr:hypothetical protein [bacterium]